MSTDPFYDREGIKELLHLFENLRTGASSVFLEEEAFEKIVDYFDDQEEPVKAMEAADIGIEYFPFSASLLFKKADLLLASRKYAEALDVLEKAELLDANGNLLTTATHQKINREDLSPGRYSYRVRGNVSRPVDFTIKSGQGR